VRKLNEFVTNPFGTAAVEFALVIPILFLVLSGLFNFGLVLVRMETLNTAINSGILYALTHSSNMTTVSNKISSATNLSPLTVTANKFCACSDGSTISCTNTCTGGVQPSTYVQISASSSVSIVGPNFLIQNPFPISNTATVRVG
jgi:hypothetical protein